MSWRGILTIVLVLGAAFSAWSLWSQRESESTGGKASGRPDYVLHDFEMVSLDEQGKESFTLRAPVLARDAGDQTIDIDTPLFLIPPRADTNGGRSGDAWEVRSKTAWISKEGDEMRLNDDVIATSDGSTGSPVKITSDNLNVFPEAKRVATPAVVTVVRPGSILRGRGLEVDLDTKRYTLKSEVRSRYVP